MTVRLAPRLPKPDYDMDEILWEEIYTPEEMMEAIKDNRNISKELTAPGRLLFLGLVRLDYCDIHRLMKPEEIENQQRKLLTDYGVNMFNFKMWSKVIENFLKMEPYATQFRKNKKTNPEAALEAAQVILNILYNLNEEL